MRANPPGRGPSCAWLVLAALAPILAGELPVGEAAAPSAGPLTAAWIAAGLSILGCFVAVTMALQVRKLNSATAPETPDLEPRLAELDRKLGRLESRLERLQRDVREAQAAPTPEPEPVPQLAHPEPVPAPAAPEPALDPIEQLLALPATTPEGARLQGLLDALAEVPGELLTIAKEAPAQLPERVEALREALDEALFGRWSAEALRSAAAGAELDWFATAQAVRERQEAAVAALAAVGLERFAPAPMALLSPESVVPSDEPPVPTTNPDLRDRVAEVTPGNGGWRLGEKVICCARARLYEWHEA